MNPATIAPVTPYGLEDAQCDESWRVRLPKLYAEYLLAYSVPAGKPARLYVASLNGADILIWPYQLFEEWALRLRRPPDTRTKNRSVISRLQQSGGESSIDSQGRLVVPKRVREALRLNSPAGEFQVMNDGVIRLTRPDHIAPAGEGEAADASELDDYVVEQYTEYLCCQGGDTA